MVTEFAINHPHMDPLKKKGLTFVGRFLMKLCCKTVFLQSGEGLEFFFVFFFFNLLLLLSWIIPLISIFLSFFFFYLIFNFSCVANELLKECTSFYDEFCEQVVQIGKENANAGVGVLDSTPEERIALLGQVFFFFSLFLFLSLFALKTTYPFSTKKQKKKQKKKTKQKNKNQKK